MTTSVEKDMLTRMQRNTLEFIQAYYLEHNCAPTTREIAAGIGIVSRGVVHRYLQALQRAGKIELLPRRHRNIVLCQDEQLGSQSIPLLGSIAAGQPIEAIAERRYVNLQQAANERDLFALLVKGDSMVDEGILDGDIVVCRRAQQASNGDIVVALILGAEVTLKRLQNHNNGYVSLLPANERHAPIQVSAKDVAIQGIFVGLVRGFNV